MSLHSIDMILVVLYFLTVLGIGAYLARRQGGTEDYFLAGRRLGWTVVGFSLFASNISSTTLVGLMGSAYQTGVSIANYEWMTAVLLVFFAIFIVPYYIQSRVYTIPEFLERRFRPACRSYFSVLTILGNVFIETAGSLYAGALVIRQFFPHIELWMSGMALAVVAGLYTAAGGLSAVVYTDVIQAIILLIGAVAMTWIALEGVGDWGAFVTRTPDEMWSMVQPIDDPTMPWLGTLLGVPILGFYYWCTNQYVVQRVLGAKDVHHARSGALFGGLLKLPVLFIMVFPGLMARELFPSITKADQVFPTMVAELLPVGLKGLVLAGFIAAIMSSVDSTLNSASTLVTMDFVHQRNPKASDAHLAKVGRIVTVTFMVISALWVPVVAQFGNLYAYLQSSLAYLFPPVVAVFLLGMFWRRTTGTAAMVGMISGHVISLGTFVAQKATQGMTSVAGGGCGENAGLWSCYLNLHFLILAGVFFFVSLLITVTVSLFTRAPASEQVAKFVWSRRYVLDATRQAQAMPWYRDFRLHAAGVLGLTVWLVAAYW
ncbi:MAG: sodium:solute symporter [Polyangiales bacterium]